MATPTDRIATSFELACERYAELGVDARGAIDRLRGLSVSLHCWQGDDVSGFERDDGRLFTLRGGMDLREQYREEMEAAGIEVADDVDHIIFGSLVPEQDLAVKKKR